MYIVAGENVSQIRAEMRNFGLELDPMRLKVVTSVHWYMPDGEFHADRVVAQYRSLVDEVVDKGFDGLYVSTDVTDVFDYLSTNLMVEKLLNYERSIGRTFRLPLEVICAYRIDQVESNFQVSSQLIQTHKNVITSKIADFLDGKNLYGNTITETLNELLGREASTVIFYHLEKTFKLSQDEIPNRIEDLDNALENIFDGTASLIKQEISRRLRRKIEV